MLRKVSFLIAAFAITAAVNAQSGEPKTMRVMYQGEIEYQRAVSQIDSVIFYEPGTAPMSDPTTMYVMEKSGDVYERPVLQIDSIIFYNPNPMPDAHTIIASAGANGSISPSGNVNVNHGADQTFDFTPNPGYEVDQVVIDGTPEGSPGTSYTFYGVTEDHTIDVTFKTTLDCVLINGVCWAKYNLDVGGVFVENRHDLGALYQWGRRTDGHESRTSLPYPNANPTPQDGVIPNAQLDGNYQVPSTHAAYGMFIRNTNVYPYDWHTPIVDELWNAGDEENPVKSVNDPCPCGWRVPTETEMQSLITAPSQWVSESGVWGRRFGSNDNIIFLPTTGYRTYMAGITGLDQAGQYFTSSVSSYSARYFNFINNDVSMINAARVTGRAIRCVAE